MRRKGFTLVELMIVMGMLLLLGSMLIPVVVRLHRVAIRTRMQADLLTISAGLEAYRLDHGDYPRLLPGGPEVDGAVLLCWSLIAPGPSSQDGADGPGFRTRGAKGQVYGPYITLNGLRVSGVDNLTAELLDRNDRPIHYCPSNPTADIHAGHGFVADYYGIGPRPMYSHEYFEYCLDLKTLRGMLGDTNNNGRIDPDETPATTGPYLLWCAGPNGLFGPDPDHQVLKPDGTVDLARSPSDDVTNFR